VLHALNMNIDAERQRQLFASVDTDGSGTVDWPEFYSMLQQVEIEDQDVDSHEGTPGRQFSPELALVRTINTLKQLPMEDEEPEVRASDLRRELAMVGVTKANIKSLKTPAWFQNMLFTSQTFPPALVNAVMKPVKQFVRARLFTMFDKDENRSLDLEEFTEVMKALGLGRTDKEAEMLLQEVDIDGNGTIELVEFLDLLELIDSEMSDEDRILCCVRAFDDKAQGFLTLADLGKAFARMGHHLTPQEVREFMSAADTDGDGNVTYSEFARLVQHAEQMTTTNTAVREGSWR